MNLAYTHLDLPGATEFVRSNKILLLVFLGGRLQHLIGLYMCNKSDSLQIKLNQSSWLGYVSNFMLGNYSAHWWGGGAPH